MTHAAIQQTEQAEHRIAQLEQQVQALKRQLQQQKAAAAPDLPDSAEPSNSTIASRLDLHQAELLTMVYEGVDHPVFVLEVNEEQEFRFLGWNPASERITGIKSTAVVGKTPEQILPPESAAVMRQHYQRCLDTGSTITYEEYHVLQGIHYSSLTTLNPLKDAAGRIYWIVGTGIDITELKQTTAALQKSEAQSRLIFDLTDVGWWDLRLPDQPITWSDTMFRLLGYRPGETEPSLAAWQDRLHPEDASRVEAEVQQMLATGEGLKDLEYRVVHPDGTVRWILGRGCVLLYDQASHPQHIVGVLIDITERKQAELALQQSEEQRRLSFDLAGIGWWSRDLATHQTTWSETLFRLIGYQVGELEPGAVAWFACVHPEDVERAEQSMQRVMSTGEPEEMEYRVVHPDGTVRWLLDRTYSFLSQQCQPERLFGVLIDVTERKQAEAELHRTQSLLKAALQIGRIACWEMDLKTQMIRGVGSFTEQWPETWETSWEESLQLVHPDDRERLRQSLKAALMNKGESNNEYRSVIPSDIVRYVLANRRIFQDEHGQPQRMIGASIDITELRQTEAELRQLNEELENRVMQRTAELQQAKEAADRANRAKGNFLANMSHEIRTPMNAILGFSELLQRTVVDAKSQLYLQAIASSGKTLLALIDDILDFSKIEAGQLLINYEPVNLRQVLQETKDVFAELAARKQLMLILNVVEPLPEAVLFDELRLRQILLNLGSNALKFTEYGSVQISLSAQPNPDGETVRLQIGVEDTGIGIDPQDQERIFELFMQSQGQSNRKYGGTGLGLAITQQLTHLLGGQIYLHSEPGVGSRFTVVFPSVQQVILPALPVGGPVEVTDLNQLRPATLLLIDDVASNRALIESYFADSLHQLWVAETGKQGLKLAKQHQPDVILLDLRLPDLNGWQVLKRLKQHESTQLIPVIGLTAMPLEPNLRQWQDFVEVLQKPVRQQQLITALKKILPVDEPKIIGQGEAPTSRPTLQSQEETEIYRKEEPEVEIHSIDSRDWSTLIEQLHHLEATIFPELCQTMKLRELRQFVAQLRDIAQQYSCGPLQTYVVALTEQLDTFNWTDLPATIRTFPALIQTLDQRTF